MYILEKYKKLVITWRYKKVNDIPDSVFLPWFLKFVKLHMLLLINYCHNCIFAAKQILYWSWKVFRVMYKIIRAYLSIAAMILSVCMSLLVHHRSWYCFLKENRVNVKSQGMMCENSLFETVLLYA